MRRAVTIVLGVVAFVLAVITVGVVLFTNTDWGRERVRRLAVRGIESKMHGIAHIGRLDGNLLRGATLTDFSLTDSAHQPFFSAQRVRVRYVLSDFLSKRIVLRTLVLDRPVVVLDHPPHSDWNFRTFFPPSTTTAAPGFGSWITLLAVRLHDGNIAVHLPWSPADSATLSAHARDSVIAAALHGGARARVVRVAGGYQEVMYFWHIDAMLPHVRLADPDSSRLFQVGALRMTALPFHQPAATIRDLRGTIQMAGDSLWFTGLDAALANSRAELTGVYRITPGALDLHVHAPVLALADVRWLFPTAPASGTGRLDLAMRYRPAGESDYTIPSMHVAVEGGTVAGEIGLAMGTAPGSLRLHDTDLRFAGLDTRVLQQLDPALHVPERGRLSGRLALAGSAAEMHVGGNITFAGARSGVSRLAVDGAAGMAHGTFDADSLTLRAAPLQVALVRAVRPTLPLTGTITGTVLVNGSTAGALGFRADLVHRPAARARPARVIAAGPPAATPGPSHLVASGVVHLATGRGAVRSADVVLRAEPLSLATAGAFAPALELRGSARGQVRVAGPLRALIIDGALRLPAGGSLALRGTVDVASPIKSYDLATTMRVFDASAVSARGPKTSLTAQAAVRGSGTTLATMRAAVAADVARSAVDSVAVDSAHVRLSLADGLLTVDTLGVRTPFAQASATGRFGLTPGNRGTLVYRVAIDSLAALRRWLPSTPADTGVVVPRAGRMAVLLARARAESTMVAARNAVAYAAGGARLPAPVIDSIRAMRRDSIAGSVAAAGRITGGLDGFDVRGRLGGTRIVARGDVVQRARAEYTWLGARTPASALAVAMSLDSVQAAGFALDSVAVRVGYRAPGGTVDLGIFQDTTYDYRARAGFVLRLDRRELHLLDLRLRFDTARWVSVRPGIIAWGGKRGIEIDSVDLRSGLAGRLFVNGTIPTQGPVNLQVTATGLRLEHITALLQNGVVATGVLDLAAHVTGTAAQPVIAGALGLVNVAYQGTPVPDLRTTFGYRGREFVAHAEMLRRGAPLAVATAHVPIDLALSGATGSRLLAGPLRADFVADSLPLDVLGRAVSTVSDVHGWLVGAIAARGTPQHPIVTGRLALREAALRVVPLGVVVRDIDGAVRLARDSLAIDSLVAHTGRGSGRGRLDLSGGVGLGKASGPRLGLRIRAQGVQVANNDLGDLYASANIHIGGPLDTMRITGNADILHGVIYLPGAGAGQVMKLNDPAFAEVIDTAVDENPSLVPPPSPLLQHMHVGLTLGVMRDTWVRSTAANVEIYSTGNLTVRLAGTRLRVAGQLNTDRGEYAFVGRRFTLTRGSVTFTGGPQIDPLLQITGAHDVQLPGRGPMQIQVQIGGTMRSPNITLSSNAQPPLSQTDLLSYLAFGRSSTSLFQTAGSSLGGQGAGSGTLAGTTAALATRQLASVAVGALTEQFEANAGRSLGADVFTVTPADIPSAFSLGGVESLLAGTQVEAGKYFGSRTFIALQARPTLAAPGVVLQQRMGGGYRLDLTLGPRFLPAVPSLSTVQTATATSVFGAFLTREWRY